MGDNSRGYMRKDESRLAEFVTLLLLDYLHRHIT